MKRETYREIKRDEWREERRVASIEKESRAEAVARNETWLVGLGWHKSANGMWMHTHVPSLVTTLDEAVKAQRRWDVTRAQREAEAKARKEETEKKDRDLRERLAAKAAERKKGALRGLARTEDVTTSLDDLLTPGEDAP